jgi:hypothetical protein
MNHVYENTGLPTLEKPTQLHEDNACVIYQIKSGFIKGDKTKHIAPKFFYTSELNGKEINVIKVDSSENVADILTKSLGSNKHWYLLPKLGMRSLKSLTQH